MDDAYNAKQDEKTLTKKLLFRYAAQEYGNGEWHQCKIKGREDAATMLEYITQNRGRISGCDNVRLYPELQAILDAQ